MGYNGSGATGREALASRLAGLFHVLQWFERLQAQQQAIYEQYAHRYRRYLTPWRGGKRVLIALALSVGVFFVLASVVIFMFQSLGNLNESTAMFLLALMYFGPLPIAFILVALRNASVPKRNAKREEANRRIAGKVERLAASELAPVRQEMQKAREEFTHRFQGWFPAKYLTSADVGACWRLVEDHRASSVQEAINVYETELHRQRLENFAAAQVFEAQRAARVAALGNIINAVGHSATAGAIRSEGAATRAAIADPRPYRR